MKKTTLFENGMIWFGAGVSIAEILTGTYLATLGFKEALLAIIIGHIIGGFLMFLAGVIGGVNNKSSMESVKMSFGNKGGLLFAILNVVQLSGWTAIMIYDGALSATSIFKTGFPLWCLVIGGLIVVWILIGITDLGKVNVVIMAALFILSIVLCGVLLRSSAPLKTVGIVLSFGAALELSVSMPLSWLPCIADYTREAKEPVKASALSAFIYCLVSTWMFLIGMFSAMKMGTGDIATIMLKAGLGILALVIIVFSTVTTTFLDSLSAGISFESIVPRFKGKWAAVIVTVIGTICAILFPMDNITNFLYAIGSVFAPMIAVMIADYFFLHEKTSEAFQYRNLLAWLIGFILYRVLMHTDVIVGYTVPDMLITILMPLVLSKIPLFQGKVKEA
jgi:putative hydroxymethylpyrimidine transporter CytX